jgi:hypothetical protein
LLLLPDSGRICNEVFGLWGCWIPAFAGMTVVAMGMTMMAVRMTVMAVRMTVMAVRTTVMAVRMTAVALGVSWDGSGHDKPRLAG